MDVVLKYNAQEEYGIIKNIKELSCQIKDDIYYADLSPVVGCDQGGVHPVLIIQNGVENRYSPTVIVAAVTSQMEKHPLPPCVY